MQFKKGEKVELISGGPPMTVKKLFEAEKSVECTWDNNNQIPWSAVFAEVTLKLVVPPSPPRYVHP